MPGGVWVLSIYEYNYYPVWLEVLYVFIEHMYLNDGEYYISKGV